MRRPQWVSAIGLAVLLAVASACGSTPGSRNAVSTTTQPPATTAPAATTAPGSPATTVPQTTEVTNPADGSIEGTEIETIPEVPNQTDPPSPTPSQGQSVNAFLTAQFNDIQSEWSKTFSEAGITYQPATLRLFTGSIETACGTETSDVGPFYCPGDATVYLDPSFFRLMETQFGVKGDFALAYVVAHEMGHHVQSLLGITTQVAFADQSDPAGMNGRSVRVELQADCLAGVWAHSVKERGKLNDGDMDSALNAAAAVGDDFLSKLSGSEAEPDTFTHGTSAQRQHWLTTGFDSGDPNSCDTFSASI